MSASPMHPTSYKLLLRLSVGLSLSLASLACDGDPLSAPADQDPTGVYTKFAFDYKAIVLSTHAPYDTVQLRAFPRNLLGDTIAHTGQIRYARVNLTDTSVAVDSVTGIVKVRKSTSGARVEARLTIGSVTRADTALIVVYNTLPVRRVARMEFFPLAPDSNWRWAGNTNAIGYDLTNGRGWVRLFDADGDTIPANQVPIAYTWDNDLVVRGLDLRASEAGGQLGETFIRARVYAYGTGFSDSVLFRRIEPTVTFMVIGRDVPLGGSDRHRFYPDSVDVKAGTTVIFMNARGNHLTQPINCANSFCGSRVIKTRAFVNTTLEWVDSTDVIFDDPSGASAGIGYGPLGMPGFPLTAWPTDGGTGNINSFGHVRCIRITSPNDGCGGRVSNNTVSVQVDLGYRSRRFNTPGTYRFHSTTFPGAAGVVVVH